MRAKEHLVIINKKDYQYLEETHQALNDLYKIRTNYAETKKYLLHNLDAEHNLNPDKYQPIRKQLRQIVQPDKTFSYFYAESSYYEDTPIINKYLSEKEVQKIITAYKEDYPKKDVDQYLANSLNRNFYTHFQEPEYTNEDWLKIFNGAYYLFDQIRIRLYQTAKAFEYLKQYQFQNKNLRKVTIKLVINLLNKYTYDLNEVQLAKKDHLMTLLQRYFLEHEKAFQERPNTSNIKLTTKKGERSDFIRVIDALYECGFFVGLNNEKTTKQEMIRAFEIALNDDFKDYHNLKASAKRTKNAGENSQMDNIFDRLKAKNKEKAKKNSYDKK